MSVADTPTVALLRQLVAFDTTTRGSNIALIEFIERYLADHGVSSRRVSSKDNRSNLYATIGPQDVPGIMLAGHTDVVPAEAEKWTSDPFTLTERGGRYYGRGTADMKGFLAAVLAAVPKFVAQPLRTPVHLAFSYDEEIGCVGVRDLLDDMVRMEVKPRWGVIGEPTSMQPAHAHKGKVAYRVHVAGLAGHSRNPDAGANAIYAAARLVLFIKDLAREVRQTGVRDDAYDYPTTSLHVGRIEGGAALNIIPAACTFDFEIRYLPGTGVEDLLQRIRTFAQTEVAPELRARDAQCGVTFEPLSAYPALATDLDAEPIVELRELLGDGVVGKIGFGTEGGLYHEIAGVPCVVCGPGDMAQGHRPDEFVSAEQLAACDAFLDRLVKRLASVECPKY